MIQLRFYAKLARIRLRLAGQLTRLWVAGKLLNFAFWLEPRLEWNLSKGFEPRERAKKVVNT